MWCSANGKVLLWPSSMVRATGRSGFRPWESRARNKGVAPLEKRRGSAGCLNRVCSRVALARVQSGAKRERGLKPRDYISEWNIPQFLERGSTDGGLAGGPDA